MFPRREEGPDGSKVTVRSNRLDFRVWLGEIRKSLVSWSGLDRVGGVKAEVPGGRGRSYGVAELPSEFKGKWFKLGTI